VQEVTDQRSLSAAFDQRHLEPFVVSADDTVRLLVTKTLFALNDPGRSSMLTRFAIFPRKSRFP
jgi:hypothetical protein